MAIPEPRRAFGSRLRAWREAAGLTQRQLGQRLGYDHTFVSRIESGTRRPPPSLPGRADDLLGTGGELSALWPARPREPVTRFVPGLPGPIADQASILAPAGLPDTSGMRLPTLGVVCPVHRLAGCSARTSPAELRQVSTGRPDASTEHAFAALLVAFTKSHLENYPAGLVTPVEWCLRRIVGVATNAPGEHAARLWHLAAQYGHLAGWLRVEQGRLGLGMLWLDRATEWGRAGGNPAATSESLARMSLVGRLERDPRSAVAYAECIRQAGRPWTDILAEVHLARGFAMTGDRDRVATHARKARVLLDRSVIDPVEAPWLCGAEGHAYVESSLAAGFRDIAARHEDQAAAGQALGSARLALDNLPARLRPSQVLLTLRLADSYACSGQPDAAVATARRVLTDAVTSGSVLISDELTGLRARLARGWSDLPEVAEFGRLLTDVATRNP